MFAYIIVTAIFILFQIFQYDLYLAVDAKSFGLGVMIGLLPYFLYFVYVVLMICSIVYAIKGIGVEKRRAFVPTAACAVVIVFFFVFPRTNLYLNLNYNLNKGNRNKTIEMIENKTIFDYAIDMNEFKTPFRQTSYTGTLISQEQDGTLKVLFYAYKDITTTRIIVYASDDSGITDDDFDFNLANSLHIFSNINKIAPNWYSATMKN